MKIVILDGYTLNPGDLSWESLKKIGTCEIYDRTPEEKILERSIGAEIVLTNKTPLRAENISKLATLEYIGLLSTGYDVVDVAAAKSKGITVTNIPTYGTPSVAQMVFSHILNLVQPVGMHSESVKSDQWSASSDFCYWIWPLIELKGKTLGIVGLGKIGREVAKISQAFDMKVIAHDRFVLVDKEIPLVEFDELLKESDFISLHCPLTAETNKFINCERISQMKSSAFIINTSRGALIDEHALADALNQGRIAGAGLDVLSKEPPIPENPLLSAKNCFITPHIAWATLEARERLLNLAASNIVAFLDGTPVNTIG